MPDSQLATFWSNLRTGFDYFEKRRALPDISIDPDGLYRFK
jgi:hypothetical protein